MAALLFSGDSDSTASDSTAIGNITFVQCTTGTNSKNSSAAPSPIGTPNVKRKGKCKLKTCNAD